MLTFYKSDYQKFIKIIQDNKLDLKNLVKADIMHIISEYNKTVPGRDQIQLIKYLSPQSLSHFELAPEKSNFEKQGNIETQDGTKLKKEGHQNCLVLLHDGHIYVHPKVRSDTQNNVIGINHSSLAKGQNVAFAGSFVHNEDTGWIIENSTGHYGTRATQMRNFLLELEKKMVPIDQLTVKLWIPKDPKNPTASEADYDIITENAEAFLERTSKSIATIEDMDYQSPGKAP